MRSENPACYCLTLNTRARSVPEPRVTRLPVGFEMTTSTTPAETTDAVNCVSCKSRLSEHSTKSPSAAPDTLIVVETLPPIATPPGSHATDAATPDAPAVERVLRETWC